MNENVRGKMNRKLARKCVYRLKLVYLLLLLPVVLELSGSRPAIAVETANARTDSFVTDACHKWNAWVVGWPDLRVCRLGFVAECAQVTIVVDGFVHYLPVY